MTVMEKAQELGEAIVETEEYQQMKKAEEKMYEDEEAKNILEDYEALQKRLQMVQSSGKQISEDQKKQYQNIGAQMQSNPKIQEYVEAQEEFNEVMETVNKVLGDVMS